MSADTIISLVALLIMCFPAVLFMHRIARRYGYGIRSSPSPRESILPISHVSSANLSLMDNGMVYAVSNPNPPCLVFEIDLTE